MPSSPLVLSTCSPLILPTLAPLLHSPSCPFAPLHSFSVNLPPVLLPSIRPLHSSPPRRPPLHSPLLVRRLLSLISRSALAPSPPPHSPFSPCSPQALLRVASLAPPLSTSSPIRSSSLSRLVSSLALFSLAPSPLAPLHSIRPHVSTSLPFALYTFAPLHSPPRPSFHSPFSPLALNSLLSFSPRLPQSPPASLRPTQLARLRSPLASTHHSTRFLLHSPSSLFSFLSLLTSSSLPLLSSPDRYSTMTLLAPPLAPHLPSSPLFLLSSPGHSSPVTLLALVMLFYCRPALVLNSRHSVGCFLCLRTRPGPRPRTILFTLAERQVHTTTT